jgi:hypothetical protein
MPPALHTHENDLHLVEHFYPNLLNRGQEQGRRLFG